MMMVVPAALILVSRGELVKDGLGIGVFRDDGVVDLLMKGFFLLVESFLLLLQGILLGLELGIGGQGILIVLLQFRTFIRSEDAAVMMMEMFAGARGGWSVGVIGGLRLREGSSETCGSQRQGQNSDPGERCDVHTSDDSVPAFRTITNLQYWKRLRFLKTGNLDSSVNTLRS